MDIKRVNELLSAMPNISVAVIGDFCLDEYLTIDPVLDEPSLETGLNAYQVVKREISPGAAGTVAKNFSNLGIGNVYAAGFTGDDGRGLEITRGLLSLGIHCENMIPSPDRITPAYIKPWILYGEIKKELNRLDIKNHSETPGHLEDEIIKKINDLTQKVDAVVIMDQMTEDNCGVITDRVRDELCLLARKNPSLLMYADSRSRISRYTDVIIKGNQFEIFNLNLGEKILDIDTVKNKCMHISWKLNKPVIVTLGEHGVVLTDGEAPYHIPAIAAAGPIDVCGGGDAFTSGFIGALAGGGTPAEAGFLGNLCASICVSQLGSTGVVTPELLLKTMDNYNLI